MTVDEAVAAGALAFADAEGKALAIKHKFRDMREVFETIRDAGKIGTLECQKLAGEADVLATKFEADVYALHSRLTERAQVLGIDLPQPLSGGR